MRSALLVCLSFLFFSCQEKKQIFVAPTVANINEVIQAVILKDSLPVYKTDKGGAVICTRLIKLDIKVMPSKKEGQLIAQIESGNYVYVQQLLYSSKKHLAYFSKKDSTYLLYQNKVNKSVDIYSDLSKKLKTISVEELDTPSSGFAPYYTLSIPIFSRDGNTAYVEVNAYFGDGGGGSAVVLKRENGEWEIADFFRTWFS